MKMNSVTTAHSQVNQENKVNGISKSQKGRKFNNNRPTNLDGFFKQSNTTRTQEVKEPAFESPFKAQINKIFFEPEAELLEPIELIIDEKMFNDIRDCYINKITNFKPCWSDQEQLLKDLKQLEFNPDFGKVKLMIFPAYSKHSESLANNISGDFAIRIGTDNEYIDFVFDAPSHISDIVEGLYATRTEGESTTKDDSYMARHAKLLAVLMGLSKVMEKVEGDISGEYTSPEVTALNNNLGYMCALSKHHLEEVLIASDISQDAQSDTPPQPNIFNSEFIRSIAKEPYSLVITPKTNKDTIKIFINGDCNVALTHSDTQFLLNTGLIAATFRSSDEYIRKTQMVIKETDAIIDTLEKLGKFKKLSEDYERAQKYYKESTGGFTRVLEVAQEIEGQRIHLIPVTDGLTDNPDFLKETIEKLKQNLSIVDINTSIAKYQIDLKNAEREDRLYGKKVNIKKENDNKMADEEKDNEQTITTKIDDVAFHPCSFLHTNNYFTHEVGSPMKTTQEIIFV